MSHVCPWWLIYTVDNAFRRLVYNTERIFTPYVEPGMTVLDMGCGRGFNTLGLARIVGREGRVIAADLQPRMLNMVRKRAKRAGLAERIQPHACQADTIGLSGPMDFVNAFWVVHELPDASNFLRQVHACLMPGGKLLVAEPRRHVSRGAFADMVKTAEAVGLQVCATPSIRWSMTVVFSRH